jgi:hypothetical protein
MKTCSLVKIEKNVQFGARQKLVLFQEIRLQKYLPIAAMRPSFMIAILSPRMSASSIE